MSKCRVIMCTNSISKMIPAIRSRCLGADLIPVRAELLESSSVDYCRKTAIFKHAKDELLGF